MKNIKLSWILTGGLILYIIYLQQCGSLIDEDRTSDVDTLSFTVDTIRITSIDTIRFTDTVIKYRTIKVSTPVVIRDSLTGDSLNRYTSDISDSLIEGEIVSTVKGVLVKQNFNYRPLFPKYIIRTDSVLISSELVLEKKRNAIFAGAETGGNRTFFNLSVMGGVHTKKGWSYGYRYGITDKSHNFAITKQFHTLKN